MSNELSLKYSHNIIDHLGLKLYQNKPTNVIAELVSNSYDADAENVWIDIKENQVTIADDGFGMTLEDLRTKYLIIGKPKRTSNNLDETSPIKGRKFMGRKGIGKLAPFGIAKKVSVLTISWSERLVNWFSIDLDKLLEKTEENDGEVEKYTPEIIADNISIDKLRQTLEEDNIQILDEFLQRAPKSGTMIILDNLTLRKQISKPKLFESMGRRFTVTLLKPDFNVQINNKIVTEKEALPEFDFRFPEEGYETETISINGNNREIKHWCGFVGKAEWSQDESGVGIYAHGKIAQDRPFVFGAKGLEITTRYMYAVIEADWVDELPTEFISTDRTSINWEDEETQEFYKWGEQTVKKWAKKFQDKKNDKNDKIVEEKLNNPGLVHITSTEKIAIKKIVTEMSPKVTNDDKLQNEVISKLTSAWLHEPSRLMINTLWDRLKLAESNHDEFIKTLENIHQHLVPESLSLSTVTAQRIYALSRLERLAINGIEEELQVLLEQFPWVLNTEKNFTANQTLKEFAKKASADDQIRAHGSTKTELRNQPDEGTRPDFAFFSTEENRYIMVVELKSPQVMLEHAHLNQLQTYMNWIKDRYSGSEVTGYLIGSGASNIHCKDPEITIKDWSKLCLENRRNYVEQLAAMIKGAYDIATPERVVKSIEFAGDEALELLSRMNDANPDFKDFMNKVEHLIQNKASKKGKKS